jgi:hypothetical protein
MEGKNMARWTVQQLQKTTWFAQLVGQIQQEVDRLAGQRQDRRPALHKEGEELSQQIQGWSLSLAKPDLSPAVRALVEADLEKAVQRRQQIEQQLAQAEAQHRQAQAAVDPQLVVDRLNRLADVLAVHNPSRTNLELSLHIEAIRCYQDGRVVVRTCKLGALAGSLELFSQAQESSSQGTQGDGTVMAARPRRRAVRRVVADDGDQAALQAAAHQAADVDRFAGLGPEWFWEDLLRPPRKTCWAEQNAAEVAQLRSVGMTHEKLAEHFGKTVPTIRKALQLAAQADGATRSLPRKMPRACWAKDNAAEVARLKADGMSVPQIAQQMGKTEPTIRAALKHAEGMGGPTIDGEESNELL